MNNLQYLNIRSSSIITCIFLMCTVLLSCDNKAEKHNELLRNKTQQKSKEIINNYKRYQKNIAKTNFSNLLNTERLSKDVTHEESEKILTNVNEIFTDFTLKNESLIAELKILMDSIKPTPEFTDIKITAMKEELNQSFRVTKLNYKQDSIILKSYSRMFDLLKEECKYKIQDDQILFYDTLCLAKFSLLNSDVSMAKVDYNHQILNLK